MIPESEILDEAKRIVETATSKGIVLRILGASAIRLHSPDFAKFHETTGRPISDIDFASYRRFGKALVEAITPMGYVIDERLYAIHGLNRHRYYGKNGLMIDVFFDKLEMCHDINFKDRLELDYPTVTVTELLLEKLQIVGLGGKDLVDTTMLLAEHEVAGPKESDCIDGSYIAEIMANDWGFYKTTTTNLKQSSDALPNLSYMNDDTKIAIDLRIKDLIEIIEREPKSTAWKMRAKLGPKKKWYREVDNFFTSQGQNH